MSDPERVLSEIIEDAVKNRSLSQHPRTSLAIQNEVLAFAVSNAKRLPEISTSALLSYVRMAQACPDTWQAQARAAFLTQRRDIEVPRIPQIRLVQPGSIIHGRFEEFAHTLAPESVDLVVCSPPYGMQRRRSYGGISEDYYPEWTSRWMAEVRRVLKPDGNVIINLHPHVRDGMLVRYVDYTIERLEWDGWYHWDPFRWIKPDAPPLGNPKHPRRSTELLHWLSPGPTPYLDPIARTARQYLGLSGTNWRYGRKVQAVAASLGYRPGVSLRPDYIVANVGSVNRAEYNTHTAQFPTNLVRPLIQMFCRPGGMVLDPFIGSGTTAETAWLERRHCIGFEKDGGSVNISRLRLKELAA